MTKLLIILNPWAGRGNAGRHRAELEAALRQSGVDYELAVTSGRGGATDLARQGAERGYERIVAVGGDGTINEVVNGIKQAEAAGGPRPRMGIIPLGTGSDFIKMLDGVVANDIRGGVQRALGERTRAVDIGRIYVDTMPPRYFINALGMGFDAQVAVESLKLTHLKGFVVYIVAVLRALTRYKAHPMSVEYDGQQRDGRLLFASVANARCQGGGFWLTPEAIIDDGVFDLCLVDNMRMDQIVRAVPLVMKGTHTRLKQVWIGRARSVMVRCPAAMPVATDGEVVSTSAREVRVELLPAGLEVLI
ncbi:diacylglycerol kinase [Kouleothrix aurantiaca]|uniref:Diacylglycerol kinase n=1 Tax=Kouleothrix aurantiaca TaxID=186479 RepID=A0A0N8PSK7_9CHLR|nr:diacylglycerol kinase [Kouleothrix aurantiaca]